MFKYQLGDVVIYGTKLDITKTFSCGSAFRIIVYCAVEKNGIVCETENGIAILDLNANKVVLTHHCILNKDLQQKEFQRLRVMNWVMFRKFINSHLYARYEYDISGVILRAMPEPFVNL